jgi:ketosteroid isomerase-like protein
VLLITGLVLGAVGHPALAQDAGEEARLVAWTEAYTNAFNRKDLAALGDMHHDRVTIYEGGSVDTGWTAYRDGHLGPELREFENLTFAFSNVRAFVPDKSATLAIVTASYSLKAHVKGREIASEGLQTFVLLKDERGQWRILHAHSSSRRRPAPPAAP